MAHTDMYDAFISYRHLPLDRAIAKALQKRLEQCRPPKDIAHTASTERKRLKLFRDKAELPTSGNLDDALKRALLASKYLVVVLSEETIHSKWCMEEVRLFKEAHGGSIAHILPIIVSGDPSDVLPPALRSETHTTQLPDGQVVVEQREVEPLCADVRTDSTSASVRKLLGLFKLRTEYLRIAAPLLGCGYDDLYRRHARRQRRILVGAAIILGALATTFAFMAFRIFQSEQRYASNLVDTYTQQGASKILEGANQEAMTYFANALALDNGSPAARSGALLMLQHARWPRLTNKRVGTLEELGLGQAGPYAVSYEDERIRFSDDAGTTWTVPLPTEVNPAVNTEEWAIFAGSLPTVREVPGYVVISYGDYVYVYDLTSSEAELKCTVDLAEIFPEQAQRNSLTGMGEAWISPDGSSVALSCNWDVAILDVERQVVATSYSNYEYALNEVVFSHDSKRVALVFGNSLGIDYQDPGGFARVSDLQGTIVYQGEMGTGLAFENACFSPNDSVLCAWGSGTLRFFDLASGGSYAEDLRVASLEGAAFDGTRLVVDDGRGHLFDCVFTAFSVAAEADGGDVHGVGGSSQASWQQSDISITSVEIVDGLSIVWRASGISLVDDEGTVRAQSDVDTFAVDRMYVHQKAGLVFAWQRAKSRLYCIPFDAKRATLGSPREIASTGRPIIGVCAAGEGFLVITGDGHLLYYESATTSIPRIMQVGMSGQVQELAVSTADLVALIVQGTDFVSPESDYHFEGTWSVEVWDLERAVRFAGFEADNTRILSDLAFDENGWLSYEKNGARVRWRVDAPDPDAATVATLLALPCLELDEDQALGVRSSYQEELTLGNWGDFIMVQQSSTAETAASDVPDEADAVQGITTHAQQLLDDKDTEGWLAYYDDIWEQVEAGELELTSDQLATLFRDYTSTSEGYASRYDQLGRGVDVYAKYILKNADEDPHASDTFDIRMSSLLTLTDAYDAVMRDYWNGMADAILERIDPSSDMNDEDFLAYFGAYEDRLLASSLDGKGLEAFNLAAQDIDASLVDYAMTNTAAGVLHLFAQDKPVGAAKLMNEQLAAFLALDPSLDTSDIEDSVILTSYELCIIARSNQLGIQTMDRFLSALDYTIGFELTQSSPENRDAGLRIGDVVVAVDGHRICSPTYLRYLQQTYPEATLTYLRDGVEHTTERITDWKFVGNFVLQKKEES